MNRRVQAAITHPEGAPLQRQTPSVSAAMLIPPCGRSIPAVSRRLVSAEDNCRPAAAGSPAQKHGGLRMTHDSNFGIRVQGLRRQAPELSFGMFSGYAEHELAQGRYWTWGDGSSEQHRRHLWHEIRACLDFAILGRFNEAQSSHLPLHTSRNQVLRLFSDRYAPADFSEELTEVSIKEGGRVEITGFPTRGLPW
jgi:hypothetical protein